MWRLATCVALVFLAASCQAAMCNVTAGSTWAAIQSKITYCDGQAGAAHTIVLGAGVYSFDALNDSPLDIPASKTWTFIADYTTDGDGVLRPQIDAQGLSPFFATLSAQTSLTFHDLRFINCQTGSGCIPIVGGTVSFVRCEFTQNTASVRGGVFDITGNPSVTITGCTFRNNKVVATLGSCDPNTPELLGGAIYVQDANLLIEGSVFSDNTAIEQPHLDYYLNPTGYNIPQTKNKDGQITGSCNAGYGADIYATNTFLTITGSSFDGSRAEADGGCLYQAATLGSLTIKDSNFAPIKARAGAGIFLTRGRSDPQFNLVVDNVHMLTGGLDAYPREYFYAEGGHYNLLVNNSYVVYLPISVFHFEVEESTLQFINTQIVDVTAGGGDAFFRPCGVFGFYGGIFPYLFNSKVLMDSMSFSHIRYVQTGYSIGAVIQLSQARTLDDGKDYYFIINNSTFTDCSTIFNLRGSEYSSGGIYYYASSVPLNITNSRFSTLQGRTGSTILATQNTAGYVALENVEMFDTSAVVGGAIYMQNTPIYTKNVVVDSTYAPTGPAVFATGELYRYTMTGAMTISNLDDGNGAASIIKYGGACYNGATVGQTDATGCCLDDAVEENIYRPGHLALGKCTGIAGSECKEFQCWDFYRTVADGAVRCNPFTGHWDWSNACASTVCGPAPTVANAVYTYLGPDAAGDALEPLGNNPSPDQIKTVVIAEYTCDASKGFGAVDGRNQMICIDGEWHLMAHGSFGWNAPGETVTCGAGLCIGITAPENGTVSSNSVPYGGMVTYGCNDGLMISGGDRIQLCNATTQQLNGTTPICVPLACDTSANNVINTCDPDNSGRVELGSTCTITCKPGYAGTFGGRLTCNAPAVDGQGLPGVYVPEAPFCNICPVGSYAVQGFVDCTPCTFGTTADRGAASQSECLCAPGYAEQNAGAGDCVICPMGAYCAGNRAGAVANAGFYQSGAAFIACVPPESCAGNGTCGVGYTDYLCGACDVGYYRLNGVCLLCPKEGPWKLVIGAVVGALIALGLVKMAEPPEGSIPSVNFAAPTIGFSFAQVTASFIDINFAWPAPLRRMCDIFSSLNLNIELANPECSISLTFWDKLQAQLFLPLVIFIFFTVVCVGLLVRSCIRDFKVPGLFRRHAGLTISHFVSGFLLFMTLAYLFLAKATVQFFSCVEREDGRHTVAKAPNLFCYDKDWNRLLPLAIFSLIFYVFGVPFVMAVIYITLRRKRGLTAASTHPLTSFFVAKYEGKFWMWECIVMLRKFAIVLFSAIFVTQPNVQALASIAVLFIAAMFTIGMRPFKWNKHDFVEISSLVASLIVLFAGLITTSDSAGPRVKTTLGVIAVVVSCFALLAVVLCFISEAYVKIYLYRKIKQMGDPTRRVMVGHTQAVTSVVLANDRTLVSGSEDKTVRVWNAMTGALVRTMGGHKEGVTCLAVLRTNYVVSGSRDGSLRLWNVRTGKRVSTLAEGVGHINCVAIAKDATMMACGTREGTLIMWRGKEKVYELQLSGDESGDEVIAPPNNQLMSKVKGIFVHETHGADGEASIEIESGSGTSSSAEGNIFFEQVHRIEHAHKGAIRAICIDGKFVFTGGDDAFTRRWSLKHETRLAAYKVHSDAVTAVMVHEGVLYTGSADATIRAMAIKTGFVIPSDTAHSGLVSSLTFEPISGNIISTSWDNTLRVWNTVPRENSKGEAFHTLGGHGLSVNGAVVHLYDGLRATIADDDVEAVAEAAKKQAKKGKGSKVAPSDGKDGAEDKEYNASRVIGLVFSASDDMTLRAFELNMARNLDIKDPLDSAFTACLKCVPNFTEPEAQVAQNEEYSNEERDAEGSDDEDNAAVVVVNAALTPGGKKKNGGPGRRQGFTSPTLAAVRSQYSTTKSTSVSKAKSSSGASSSST